LLGEHIGVPAGGQPGTVLGTSRYFVSRRCFILAKKEDQNMPVLEERKGVPRSALRYKPAGQDQSPERTMTRGRSSQPDTSTTAAAVTADDLVSGENTPQAPVRRRAHTSNPRRDQPSPRVGHRPHPLLFIAIGLLGALLLWIGLTWFMAWGNGVLDLLQYGYPRTYQVDAVVGQGDSAAHPSHFLALNLHGQIVIIDFLAGNPARAREFTIPGILGPNADQMVVTLRFIDVSHTGRPDMIITAGGVETFLVNADGTFRPPTPDEQQQILTFLQQSR
jgi:hypothetical protein